MTRSPADTVKHTPGPWSVSAGAIDNPRVVVENDLGLSVCALSLRGVHGDTRKMEANAHLIAAAPEMYEALKKARVWLDFEGKYSLIGIDMALAKAEGRTNG